MDSAGGAATAPRLEDKPICQKQQFVAALSARLTALFDKGFDVTNLRNMHPFHLTFSIRETVSLELSWSHYNALARVESPSARDWYMQEAISQNWSASENA